jgi:hypothetical protein
MTIPPKKVVNADAGTADIVGGNDWDDLADWMNNVDKTGPVKINTRTYFRSGKKELRNPLDTASYIEIASAITTDRNVTEPLLAAGDTRVYEAHAQTLTNKTLLAELNTLALRRETVVTNIGGTTYAIKSDGTIGSSSATPEIPIQWALDSGDNIVFLPDSTYTLSAGFTGFTITTGHKTLEMSTNTKIMVPQGFTGACIKLEGNVLSARIRGGKLDEAGTPAKLWKGIHLKSTSSSAAIKHCHFDHIQIDHAGWMVYLECTASGAFINSCEFHHIYGYYPIVGFEWVDFAANDGFIHNYYNYIDVQADSNTLYGFKNAMSRNPVFINPTVQDMDSTDTQMVIDSSATDTLIIGGSLLSGGTTGLFTDNGSRTRIFGSRSGAEALRMNAGTIVTDTTTGLKIGTSTTQKLGFFNKTPIVQEPANADTSGATLANVEIEVNQIKQLLRNYGLMA